jgi:Arc/MetJ-type ribon-helix-helix transcriptional regulator
MGKKMKENSVAEVRVAVKPTFYKKIQEKCDANFRTISEVVRELLSKWLKEDK